MSFEVNKGKDFVYIIPVVILIGFMYLMLYKDGAITKDTVRDVVKKNIITENKEKDKKENMNLEIGKKYTTDSGLVYEVITLGQGEKPEATDTVEVHYEGTLEDGTIFDSSYARGEKISFPLSGVIPG
jgi:FKBP-type peptidyl-prolyl cis-trans isomerase